MIEPIIKNVKGQIELQIAKVNRILDKRSDSGQHFDDFMREEKAKLYGMLHIYWTIGGEGFQQFKIKK